MWYSSPVSRILELKVVQRSLEKEILGLTMAAIITLILSYCLDLGLVVSRTVRR